MAKERGWWSLDVNVELDDVDRDHIAAMIREGFTSGEVAVTEEEEASPTACRHCGMDPINGTMPCPVAPDQMHRRRKAA